MGLSAGSSGGQASILVKMTVLLVTKNRHRKLMITVLFYVWEDARSWGH